ncbi:hypothetical protein OF83DRAFT_642270 [Amylostereum chailletii]|nr:hypothetical protein OF83DRAFT_642270 [Amylostereum chailletii]
MDRTSAWVHGHSTRRRTSSLHKSISVDALPIPRTAYDSERGEVARSAVTRRKKRVLVIANAVDGDIPHSEQESYAFPSKSLPRTSDDRHPSSGQKVGSSSENARAGGPPTRHGSGRRRRLFGPRAPRIRVSSKCARSSSLGCLPNFTDIRWPVVEEEHAVAPVARDRPPAHSFGWREMQWISYLPVDVLPCNDSREDQGRLISRRTSKNPREDGIGSLFGIPEGDFTQNALGLRLLGSASATPSGPARLHFPPPPPANQNKTRSSAVSDAPCAEKTSSEPPKNQAVQTAPELVMDDGDDDSGTKVFTLEGEKPSHTDGLSTRTKDLAPSSSYRRPFEANGWHMHRLPHYVVYFSHPAKSIVTDIDLRMSGRLEGVTQYLAQTTAPPPGWEMWLRRLEDQDAEEYACSWINHERRVISIAFPRALDEKTSLSSEDGTSPTVPHFRPVANPRTERDMDISYWSFVKTHPAHMSLPTRAFSEAKELLTWSYTGGHFLSRAFLIVDANDFQIR